jgi:hypothetical protein
MIVKRNSISKLLLSGRAAVGSVETVKKPSAVGEAVFKLLWESAW